MTYITENLLVSDALELDFAKDLKQPVIALPELDGATVTGFSSERNLAGVRNLIRKVIAYVKSSYAHLGMLLMGFGKTLGMYLSKSGAWIFDSHGTELPVNRGKGSPNAYVIHVELAKLADVVATLFHAINPDTCSQGGAHDELQVEFFVLRGSSTNKVAHVSSSRKPFERSITATALRQSSESSSPLSLVKQAKPKPSVSFAPSATFLVEPRGDSSACAPSFVSLEPRAGSSAHVYPQASAPSARVDSPVRVFHQQDDVDIKIKRQSLEFELNAIGNRQIDGSDEKVRLQRLISECERTLRSLLDIPVVLDEDVKQNMLASQRFVIGKINQHKQALEQIYVSLAKDSAAARMYMIELEKLGPA
jgi:hypothetical protein